MGTTYFPDIVRIFSATAELVFAATATGTAGPSLTYGAAAPSLAKAAGSLYLRTNGVLYVNTDGTTSGWKAVSILGGAGSTLLAASIAASTTISNTAARTVFSSTVSLAANTLLAGDVVRVTAWGTNARAAMETFLWDLSFGGTALAAPAAIAAVGDWRFTADLTIRAVGAAGVGAASSSAQSHVGTAPTTDQNVNTANIDTTIANTLGVAVTMSAAATGTSATMQGFIVEKLRA